MAARAFKKNVGGDWEWTTDPIKCVLVDYGLYTLDLVNHEFLSDVPVGARVAISATLTGKTRVNGVLDADDAVFTAVTGPSGEAIVTYIDTGVDTTSRLLHVFDTTAPGVPGLPVSPNGGDIVVTWDNGPNKIVDLDYIP